MLENETFLKIFIKSNKEEGRGGSENGGVKIKMEDSMVMFWSVNESWFTTNETYPYRYLKVF